MSEPFLAEVKIIGFNFAPRGWAYCDGQILPIAQNQSLYSLLGTTYGGDGRTTFALPDLRGRTPIHVDGSTHPLGQKSGEEAVSLSTTQTPSHSHTCRASSTADTDDPSDGFLGLTEDAKYNNASSPTLVDMGAAIANAGSGQGHENMQPFLTLGYCIALTGTFPSRN